MASQARFLRFLFDAPSSLLSGNDGSNDNRFLEEDVFDSNPEDVDLTEAGWSTDFAITVLGLCFIITSFTSYDKPTFHFMYMHLGTAIAHLFGGFAHALYPNRASDGVGMVGFYVTIGIGYLGNCMRYGFGWGLPKCWGIIAVLNMVWLLVAGIFAIVQMERTTDRIDDSDSTDPPFLPDVAFGYGELFCAVMEIIASVYYVCRIDRTFYAFAASISNLVGWISVYATGLWSVSTDTEYDSRITQLIFHYAMLVFLWAINELALDQVKGNSRDDGNAKNRRVGSSSSEVEDA